MLRTHLLRGACYVVKASSDLSDEEVAACARLFSEHYGVWTETGRRVRMSPTQFRKQQTSLPGSQVVLALLDGELVGHAFAVYFDMDGQRVAWLTQLVVHSDHRRKGIATTLYCKTWDPDCSIWGLVTSHPAAVRALEKATRRKCDPARIARSADRLLATTPVGYARGRRVVGTTIDTAFQVDHTEVNRALAETKDWQLGDLLDGWEFFAFVFSDQVYTH